MRPALAALLVAALPLLAPPVAAAQDSVGDQYTPSVPNGGGPEPAPPPDTDANTSPTPDPSTPADPDPSGGGDGDGSAAALPAGGGGATPPGGATATRDPDTAAGDEGTLKRIAATGQEQQRAGDHGHDGDHAATARLLRGSDGSEGMGFMLWVVMGATLLWAVASGVSRARGGRSAPPTGDGRLA